MCLWLSYLYSQSKSRWHSDEITTQRSRQRDHRASARHTRLGHTEEGQAHQGRRHGGAAH